jgi:hypothetical protein
MTFDPPVTLLLFDPWKDRKNIAQSSRRLFLTIEVNALKGNNRKEKMNRLFVRLKQ